MKLEPRSSLLNYGLGRRREAAGEDGNYDTSSTLSTTACLQPVPALTTRQARGADKYGGAAKKHSGLVAPLDAGSCHKDRQDLPRLIRTENHLIIYVCGEAVKNRASSVRWGHRLTSSFSVYEEGMHHRAGFCYVGFVYALLANTLKKHLLQCI